MGTCKASLWVDGNVTAEKGKKLATGGGEFLRWVRSVFWCIGDRAEALYPNRCGGGEGGRGASSWVCVEWELLGVGVSICCICFLMEISQDTPMAWAGRRDGRRLGDVRRKEKGWCSQGRVSRGLRAWGPSEGHLALLCIPLPPPMHLSPYL